MVDTNSFWAKVCTRFVWLDSLEALLSTKLVLRLPSAKSTERTWRNEAGMHYVFQAWTADGKSCCFQQNAIVKRKFPFKRMKDAGQTNVLAQKLVFWSHGRSWDHIFVLKPSPLSSWVSSHIESAKLLSSMRHKELNKAGSSKAQHGATLATHIEPCLENLRKCGQTVPNSHQILQHKKLPWCILELGRLRPREHGSIHP